MSCKQDEVYVQSICRGMGQTAMIVHMVQNQFMEHYDPIVEDSYKKS